MKNILRTSLLLPVCLGALFIFSTSCSNQKEADEENKPAQTTGKYALHLHTQVGESEVETYDSVYTDEDGRSIKLSLAQFYLSEIELVRLDGSAFTIRDKRILKTLEEDVYEVGDVPAGNYQFIRFKIGLLPAINQLNPNGSADSALLSHPEMWFGAAAQPQGYVFMHVQGEIDTTTHKTGTNRVPFDVKIGTNAHLVQVTMPVKNFSIVPGTTTFAHILTDYGKLFSGIELTEKANLNITTVAENGTPVAQQLSANIASMFGYEE